MHSNVAESFVQGLLSKVSADGIQELCVGAVILRGEKVLLIERAASDFMGGFVEVPGGRVEGREGLLAALAREVKEETGLDVASVSAYIGLFDYVSGSGKTVRQFNFLVDVTPGEVELNPVEHVACFWVPLRDQGFPGLNISPEVKSILSQVF